MDVTGKGSNTAGSQADRTAANTALAIEVAAPDSKKALSQLLISTLILSGIAVGQVVTEIIPKITETAAPLVPANYGWALAALTTVGSLASVWLQKQAGKNHIRSVTDALYTDSQRVHYKTDTDSP